MSASPTTNTRGTMSIGRIAQALLRDPAAVFREVWSRPVVGAPLRMHALAAVALGAATVARGAQTLANEVEASIDGANGTIVTLSVGMIVVTVAPVIAILGCLATASVGHVAVRLFGVEPSIRVSVSWVAIATLPLALRNLLLALAIALVGGDVTGRLGSLRYGDPLVLGSALLVFVAARSTLRLERVPSVVIALVLTALPLAVQSLLL